MSTVPSLIRELGRFPVTEEYKLRSRKDACFPSHTTIRRIGPKGEIATKIASYCATHSGFDDVLEICRPIAAAEEAISAEDEISEVGGDTLRDGYVYLVKSGRHYKSGRSNSAGRREYELNLQLLERATTVHAIATDDPVGIEAYWHKRFESKRLNGEWFKLDKEDVRAFKRRKFM